jgi:hypothetical protein
MARTLTSLLWIVLATELDGYTGGQKRYPRHSRVLSQNREIGVTRCGQASPSVLGQCLNWVKNGPDALEMGFLFYPRKQTLRCRL